MPRPQKGGVVTYLRKDGLTTYSLRVPYGGERILVKARHGAGRIQPCQGRARA